MEHLYIGADNSIVLDRLRDSADHSFINSATVRFTLYRLFTEDGVMTAGSANLSSEAAGFVAGDVGKAIIVPGAGEDHSDLRTTIAARTSSSVVVLSAAAVVAVTYAHVFLSVPAATSVLMPYVSGSNGKYRGTLDAAVKLAPGEIYRLAVSINGGSERDDFREVRATAMYRQQA